MGMMENLNRRAGKLGIIDLKLAQSAACFFALIIAKLIPQIMSISIWWFVGLGILCALKPGYTFWVKK